MIGEGVGVLDAMDEVRVVRVAVVVAIVVGLSASITPTGVDGAGDGLGVKLRMKKKKRMVAVRKVTKPGYERDMIPGCGLVDLAESVKKVFVG